VFWNISIFDKYYLEQLFGEFIFPDDMPPDFQSISKLQSVFLEWFRKEREKELLTYPVLTSAMLVNENGPKDKEFMDMCAEEMSKGLSFFIYESKEVDSLASCCRLHNELADNTFSYTLGAGGVSTGSFRVITININRWIQTSNEPLENILDRLHMYLVAHKEVLQDYIESKMCPAYTAGFIKLGKQFGTIGVNGVLEGMEYLGYSPENDLDAYQVQINKLLKTIYDSNKEAHKLYGFRFNTEFVPAESLGVKNAQWDKHDGLVVFRDCYNSYFYPVESNTLDILDKMYLHGEKSVKYLDGGSACHLNIGHLFTKNQAIMMMILAAEFGTNYWTFNCLMTCCEDCGYINVNTEDHCIKCGSKNVTYATRIIGYLKKITSWSAERIKEGLQRYYN
jgi:ribonucleoside-triphosphate reductase (formate)